MTPLAVFLFCYHAPFSFFPISQSALELRGSSWQVTRVVKPDEIGTPDKSLREQTGQLKFSFQEGENTLTCSSHACTPDDLTAVQYVRGALCHQITQCK